MKEKHERILELNRELEQVNALIDEADDVINGIKEPDENEELHGLSGNYDSMEETREHLLSERDSIKQEMARIEEDGTLT